MARTVKTDLAPEPVGPYSQAVVVDDVVFCSGQIGTDPRTGFLVSESVAEQTEQCLANLSGILQAAGSSLGSVVKTTVYLTSMEHFKEMNSIYAHHFPEHLPARSAVAVAELPLKAKVEIEAVALVE